MHKVYGASQDKGRASKAIHAQLILEVQQMKQDRLEKRHRHLQDSERFKQNG